MHSRYISGPQKPSNRNNALQSLRYCKVYRERNSAVWCGTGQCTYSCSLLRRISPYTLFYYDKMK